MARLAAACLVVAASLAVDAEAPASEPVVVLQETRTPGQSKDKHRKPAVQHVALLKNTSGAPVRVARVSVEFYDFFGTLLWARSAVPVPARIGPGETATLQLTTPALEAARRTRYRFEYAGARGGR